MLDNFCGHLLIRTEITKDQGWGHAVRCLALAQAWQQKRGSVIFAVSHADKQFEERLKTNDIEIHTLGTSIGTIDDARATVAFARGHHIQWVVVDGYQFNSKYQYLLKRYGMKILWVDDYGHASPYCADLVLNQNISANKKMYALKDNYVDLLLGTSYALLRKDFTKRSQIQINQKLGATRLLVTLGGCDPHQQTLKVLAALSDKRLKRLEVIVVIGSNDELFTEATRLKQNIAHEIQVKTNVPDMSDLIQWADIVISSGGSTCWEIACLGTPNIVIVVAENQIPIANGLSKIGAILNLGWHQSLATKNISDAIVTVHEDADLRRTMSHQGQKLVDGRGASRVISEIIKRC